MKSLIDSPAEEINVMDAGTTMRFLTAYFAITGQKKVITGTPRMKERPIGLLVNALRTIGADVRYTEKEGFPPVETRGFKSQAQSEVTIPGNVSSQYISALMMVAPLLPRGLSIRLVGKVGSKPYIAMTESLMKHFGVESHTATDTIKVAPAQYVPKPYRVEADWSGASYWFAFTALARRADILLPNVSAQSTQGDRAIVEIMEGLGVTSSFTAEGLRLGKSDARNEITWDFTDCPDLAQTVLPVCAAKGVRGTFTGLESLFIKETDRVAALRRELGKIGAHLTDAEPAAWTLEPGSTTDVQRIDIETYHDHRMAMGLAPLATLMDVTIDAPDVVNKSYPTFWDDMRTVGFAIA